MPFDLNGTEKKKKKKKQQSDHFRPKGQLVEPLDLAPVFLY